MMKYWFYNKKYNRLLLTPNDLPNGQFSKKVSESEASDLHIRKGAGITEVDKHG